jgi:hypothetical protein
MRSTSKCRCGHDGGSAYQGRDAAGFVSEGVEERVDNEIAIALVQIGEVTNPH